ncbi:hypothetical protein [Paraburkholderia unamae]|uniref:Uncharacterized protein n=1 Tax=Paraburkholderia unamae TaxID=219649 RepID=A0ABX5KRQ0_9BURK|nr:hypothetical protein [Paraburkholderia unamae]PVX84563.1 hypothetical protein C7402_105404 [Paraburkholderia unamae]RAR51849.1 hypothetical protein C7401_13512 [Paraburkholderia unamae]CAG9250725.1 conserved exported hypothetical protein [Paraburkholderia unamae]
MTRYHALTFAAALLAFASASPVALAQAGGHATALNAARPMQMQKVAKSNQKGVQTAKATKPAPQSLRWLLSDTP